MLIKLQPDLYQVRSFMVASYILINGEEVCLIDGGFIGALPQIGHCLEQRELSWQNITSILLTHGHIDHTSNLAEIQKRSGAKLNAHPLETEHIAAKHRYRGISRLCGLLETISRKLFGFTPPRVDSLVEDDQQLSLAGGIQVIHTPGHTAGHCGYLWEKHNLFFSGDLFATGHKRTFLPPRFLNSCPEHFANSFKRVLDLKPAGILSNHCNLAPAPLQKRRFEKLAQAQFHLASK